MFSPDKDYIVYSEEEWWSEKWNPMDYARDFDFSKTFFEQYKDFMKNIPHKSLINNYKTNENSNYANFT